MKVKTMQRPRIDMNETQIREFKMYYRIDSRDIGTPYKVIAGGISKRFKTENEARVYYDQQPGRALMSVNTGTQTIYLAYKYE